MVEGFADVDVAELVHVIDEDLFGFLPVNVVGVILCKVSHVVSEIHENIVEV